VFVHGELTSCNPGDLDKRYKFHVAASRKPAPSKNSVTGTGTWTSATRGWPWPLAHAPSWLPADRWRGAPGLWPPPIPSTALRLAKALGTSPQFWLTGQLAVALYRASHDEEETPAARADRACVALRSRESWLSLWLIHRRPASFTDGRPDCFRAVHGRSRPAMNTGAQCWKACWGQPLKSSNLLSSATLT
jgi:hypothetical protein